MKFQISNKMWNILDTDFGGDETANFGPRKETGTALYQIDTIATVSCQDQVNNMSHIMKKPVFRVCDQVILKPACSTSETSKGLEISDLARKGNILSRQQTTKMLIRPRGCAG